MTKQTNYKAYCPMLYQDNRVMKCLIHNLPCYFSNVDKNQCEEKRRAQIEMSLDRQFRDFHKKIYGLEDDLDD